MQVKIFIAIECPQACPAQTDVGRQEFLSVKRVLGLKNSSVHIWASIIEAMYFMFTRDVDQVFFPGKLRVDIRVEYFLVAVIRKCQHGSARIANLALADKVKPAFGSNPIDGHEVNMVFQCPGIRNDVGRQPRGRRPVGR